MDKNEKEVNTMKLEEMQAVLKKIGENLDNQALATELLSQVGEAYEAQHTQAETLSTEYSEKEKQIEELKKTNMNLFLKIGNKTESDKLNDQSTGEESKLTYDELLKDFGVGEENEKK